MEVAGIEPASFSTSPGLLRSAACCAFLSPGGHAGQPPTGSVAVWCPAHPRDRDGRWILLADARHRAGGTPGLTTSNSRSGREGEVSALYIGTYWFAVTGFTRLCPPSSARFSWINYRSRSLVTPMLSCLVSPWACPAQAFTVLFTLPCKHAAANSDSRGRRSGRHAGMRMPPWALAVAETHPRGLTGRVGAGLLAGSPPR